METTSTEKDQIRTIIDRLIRRDEQWFSDQAIVVGKMANRWILNYAPSPRTEFNRLVRGMVVQMPEPGWTGDPLDLVKSFPFIRFFNQGEEDADPVDLANAEMLEKLDGTMVGVFFPTGETKYPLWHTRKQIFDPDDAEQIRLMKFLEDYVGRLMFTDLDTPFTYIFEFLHHVTAVRTRYRNDQYGLYLIGARNVKTHRELSEKKLDHVAARICCHRPRRWDALVDHDEIRTLMKEISEETPDFEGFVFRDRDTGARIKFKDPDYVSSSHLGGVLSYRSLIPKVFDGEETEIIAYIPAAKEIIEQIWQQYRKYVSHCVERITYWKSQALDRKSLALKVFDGEEVPDSYLRSQIMKHGDAAEIDEIEITRSLEESLRELAVNNPKRLAELLCLDDDA